MAEMRRGVSIRLGVDDGEAKRRIAEFGTTAETALRKVETSSEGSSRELRQLANSIEAAKRQADPLYAAQQRLAKVTADYNAAVRRGIATEEERGRVLGQLQARYDLLAGRQAAAAASTASFAAANQNASRFSGRFGNTIQQVGFQVGDFATQVASGGNAMTAFVQQGSQLLGFFGPAGAIAGAALAVGAVAANFLLLGDNTDEATGSVRENDRALRDWTITANQAGMSAEALVSRNNAAARSFRNLTIEQKRQAMESNLTRQAELNDQIIAAEGRARELQRLNEAIEKARQANPRQIHAPTHSGESGMKVMRDEIAALREEADKLSKEIGEAQTEIGKYLDVPLAFSTEVDKAAKASRGAASAAKQQRDATRDLKDGVAAYIADLRTQNEMLRLEEGEREKVEAVARAQNLAMEQGNLLTAEQIDLIRELVGEKQRITDATEAQKRSEEEARRTAERAAEEQRRTVEKATDDVVQYAGDTFADLFADTGKSWRDMWDDMVSWAMRALARIAAEAVIRPIIQPVVAGALGGGVVGSGLGFTGLGGGAGAQSGGFGLGNLSSLGNILGGPSLSPGLDAFAQSTFGFGQISNFAGQAPGAIGPFQAPGLLGGGNALAGFSSASNLLGIGGAILPGLLSGNFVQAGFGGAGAALGTLIAPGIGTALGGFLGNLIGGLFKSDSKGKAGLETLPTPADRSNPFISRDIYAHRAGPFGTIGLVSGADKLQGSSDELVDAAGQLDKAVARLLDDSQIAAVTQRLQAGPGLTIKRSSFKEADFTGLLLDRATTIMKALGAGSGVTFDTLGISAKDENALGKAGDMIEQLIGTLDFLKGPIDDYTKAARDQVGAIVAQADAIRESVETFQLSSAQAQQAEARIREEALKLLNPEQDTLSDTEKAIRSLSATFDELRANADKLGLTLADIDPAQRRAMEDLAAGFNEANRRAILGIADPLALALEDFEKAAAQRVEDARSAGAEIALVERRNALERQKVVEQFADQATVSLDPLKRLLDDLTIGPLGGVAPVEALRSIRAQFTAVSAQALAGDASQFGRVEELGRLLVEQSRTAFASGAGFQSDRNRVVDVLERLTLPAAANADLGGKLDRFGQDNARGNAAIVTELKALRSENASLREDVSRLTTEMRRIASSGR